MAERWPRAPLSNVVELRRGFDLPHSARRDGPFPVLSAGLTTGWHDEGPIKGPGFVIGRATNLGRPTWCETDFWPLNTTLYAADFKGNWPRWTALLFETLDLTGFDSGSVQPMLNRNNIASLQVAVPPLPEQRAIAEVLGALDDKIAANTRLATTADELAIAIAARVIIGSRLGDHAVVARAMVGPESVEAASVDLYSLPAFDAGRTPERVEPATIKSGKFVVDRPAVLISKLNPRIPRLWEVPSVGPGPALASTEFVVLHPSATSTAVLWALVSQPQFSEALESKVAGTSGSHQRVKPEDVLATPIGDLAALSEDDRSQIDSLTARAHAARAESVTLAATRDALLPALMSGRLRVRDAERLVSDLA